MSLSQRWAQHQSGGFEAAAAAPPTDGLDALYLAILAFGQQNIPRAAGYAQAAAAMEPEQVVFGAAARYLAGLLERDKPNVYALSDGFAAFIRGGGNIPLYSATSAALREAYLGYPALRLLDVGSGDGLALLPALPPQLLQLDVVEPSASLLEQLRSSLIERAVRAQFWNTTIQEFSATQDRQWDVAQSTFCLHTQPPAELAPILAWLRQHAQRLLIVEFDVPDWSHQFAPERVRYMVKRYELGVAEYSSNRDLVAQGFLMPVLFGNFDPTAARVTHERPIAEWVALLRAAGFGKVVTRRLYPYWWASAYLVDAT